VSEHHYISTACVHDRHDRCRRTCKFGAEPSLCSCGHPGALDLRPTADELAAAYDNGHAQGLTDAAAHLDAEAAKVNKSNCTAAYRTGFAAAAAELRDHIAGLRDAA
jgi:hypothetical protein